MIIVRKLEVARLVGKMGGRLSAGETKPLNPKFKERVAAATVRICGTKSQGVLVPGGYILTAAHCINWEGTGSMTLGSDCVDASKLRTAPSYWRR